MNRDLKLKELLKTKSRLVSKIEKIKKNLDHPHGDWQSGHDLAESEYKVYMAHLGDIEKEIRELQNNP